MKKVLILLSLVASSILADIGEITALRGTALLIHNGATQSIKVGTILDVHDEIKTDAKSKLQIVFKDKTVISLGQKSHFKIDEYLYEDKKVAANFSVKKGFFKSITGRIGKIAPKRFKIKTANATIGVRGTTIIAEVTPKRDIIACSSGQIVVTNEMGSMMVNAGERTIVDSMKMPRESKKINKVILNQLDSKSNIEEVQTPDASSSKIIKGDLAKKEVNLVEEKTSEKFKPWLESVEDFIPSKYEEVLGTKNPSYEGAIINGTVTDEIARKKGVPDSRGAIVDSSVKLNFDLGNAKVDGSFNFKDPLDKLDKYIDVAGKMRSDGSFVLSDTGGGYHSDVKGELKGENFKSADGSFNFTSQGASSKIGEETIIYKKIKGDFKTKQVGSNVKK